MAGALIKIAETTVSSDVASLSLTGIDTTYDVYLVTVVGAKIGTDVHQIRDKLTKSGSATTSSDYSQAYQRYRTENTLENKYQTTGQSTWGHLDSIGTGTGEALHERMYIFGAPFADQYTYITWESVFFEYQPYSRGIFGTVLYKEASAVDGIHFFGSNGSATSNITAGRFSLYGLKK